MSFLKKLFGGPRPGDDAIYVYIKIRRTGEIAKLRIHKGNDLSRDDEGRLFVRKMVMGSRSFERVEATLYFDDSYHLQNAELVGGEISTEKEYLAHQP